ncbi:MAG: hypothetical protein ABDH61_01610 [Acidilobaceae archaeon]
MSYLAEIEYPDGKRFSEMFSALSNVLDEVLLRFTESGVTAGGLDPARVAYVELEIPKGAMRHFSVEQEVVAGLNLRVLSEVPAGKAGRPVVMRVSHEEVELEWGEDMRRKYVMPNLEVQQETIAPKTSHSVRAAVMGEVLVRALKDIEAISDLVELEAGEEGLTVRAPEGRGRAAVKIARGSPALIKLEVEKPAREVYDISYLKKVLGVVRFMESVTLSFSSGGPLEIVMSSFDGTKVRYVLAPAM